MEEAYVYLFVSRNKDNAEVKNFKPRKRAFILKEEELNTSKLEKKWKQFVADGKVGELSRFYVSVNPRDMEKVKRQLTHRLIEDEINLFKIERTVCALANKDENKRGRDWLLDIDKNCSEEEMYDIIKEINQRLRKYCEENLGMKWDDSVPKCVCKRHTKTLNGWHVVTSRFNKKILEMSDHRDVLELIDDGMFFVTSERKEK